MARLSKNELLDRVVVALESGGWNYLVLSTDHPFDLVVYRGEDRFRTRVYIWRVTHGGGIARAANEYRIQITSGVTRFDTANVDRTLVLGWWEDIGVFAGFDVSRHLGTLGSSPSLQIHEETLRQAAVDLIATYRKSSNEIAVAFVPSFLGFYVADLPALHRIATSQKDMAVLDRVIAEPDQAQSAITGAATEKRKTVLAQIARQIRDTSFTDRVVTAYSYACAMCGVQLRLIDAAHILPAAETNNDATSNGLALCATHHRAFDRALVTVRADYRVAVNPRYLARLADLKLSRGLKQFRSVLRPQILLPPNRADRPNPDMVNKGNELRGWTRYEMIL
jgi:putative restriction endonuclease